MLEFIISVLVFSTIVALISFVVNSASKSSNEPIGTFIKSSELYHQNPLHTVQTLSNEVHSETTPTAVTVVAVNEKLEVAPQEVSEDVLNSVFEEIETNTEFVMNSVSNVNKEALEMLDELYNELQPTMQDIITTEQTVNPIVYNATQDESVEFVESSIEDTNVTEKIQEVIPSTSTCIIPSSELERLNSLYGNEKMEKVTTTPAYGRSGESDVMIGRVIKKEDKYFLTYNEASIEVNKAASLFVGEMVIIHANYLNESFIKVEHIELIHQVSDDDSVLSAI